MESPSRFATPPQSLLSQGSHGACPRVLTMSLVALAMSMSWTLQAAMVSGTRFSDNSEIIGADGGGGAPGSLAVSYRNHPRDSYPQDWDEEWATMSGRVQKPKCVDIPANLSLCQNIDYDKMMLPNLLQHDSLDEVTQQARSWVPLVGIHCHPDTRVFLCSLFSPVCLDREIYPCRTLCQAVRDSCRHRMKHYGFDWPDMLRCDKFPEDNDMCISLRHDVKPDNNCSACKHPATYEAIIDNYCRAEFVSRVKIDRTEPRGMDRALILKKSKRYYKKENITKKERSGMEPLLPKGGSCVCGPLNDTSSKRFLLMGSHNKAGQLEVTYVMEFLKKSKDFRRAFKDMRKGNVCRSIIDELSSGDVDKKFPGEKDDGICIACKMPVRYVTIVENYCLAEFVLRVSVTGIEARDGHQALLMKKRRKNYKRGSISSKEVRSMVPVLDGREGCTCDLVAPQPNNDNNDKNKKKKKVNRFLVFGSKRDDHHYINYVTPFNTKDKEFKKALKAIRKGDACVSILQGSGLGLEDEDQDQDKAQKGKGGGGGGKGGKKGGKKGKRKGRKGRKGKKKGGKKGGRRGGGGEKGNRNPSSSNRDGSSADGLNDNKA